MKLGNSFWFRKLSLTISFDSIKFVFLVGNFCIFLNMQKCYLLCWTYEWHLKKWAQLKKLWNFITHLDLRNSLCFPWFCEVCISVVVCVFFNRQRWFLSYWIHQQCDEPIFFCIFCFMEKTCIQWIFLNLVSSREIVSFILDWGVPIKNTTVCDTWTNTKTKNIDTRNGSTAERY